MESSLTEHENAAVQAVPATREAPAPAPRRERPNPDGVIYIGSQQNVMSYVLAVVTQFNAGERSVRLKARGRAMSRAIDVTQIVKHRFFNSLEIKEFKVNTEEVPNEDGTKSRVSSLLLVLAK